MKFVFTPTTKGDDASRTRLVMIMIVVSLNVYIEYLRVESVCYCLPRIFLLFNMFPFHTRPFKFSEKLGSNFITSSMRTISCSADQLAPLFLFAAVIILSMSFSDILEKPQTTMTTNFLRKNIM